MSRRRYISTDISTDPKVAELAEHGTLPMLLYTWAIPHMDDWGRLIGEPRQFKLMVCPALDVTAAQIQEALEQIAAVGLWALYEVEGKQYIAIPEDKWFRYQTYINKAKRTDDSGSNIPPPPNNAEKHRTTPQNAVSPPPSPSPTPSKEDEEDDARAGASDAEEQTAAPKSEDPEWTNLFSQVFRGNVNDIVRDELAQACDEFGVEMVKEAMRRSLENADGPPRQYLKGTLDGWRQEGIFSLARLHEADEERKARKQRQKRAPPVKRRSAVDDELRKAGVL